MQLQQPRSEAEILNAWLPYNAPFRYHGATMFQNPEIALDSLPGTEELDWQSLHPNFKRRLRLQRALFLLVVAIALATASLILEFPRWPVLLLTSLWVILAVVLLGWPTLSVPRKGYVVRDKDIVFRSGVVWRSVTAIPFNRIQHVETSNTPFDRRFDIATLQLFTAGGASGDLRIDGLGRDTAEQLRVFTLEKAGASIEDA